MLEAEKIEARLRQKLDDKGMPQLESNEEYYFLLGQLLAAAFEAMGGADKHWREYNHLTNPSLACSIQKLEKRITRFLSNMRELIYSCDEDMQKAYVMIMKYDRDAKRDDNRVTSYEEAFSYGLHGDSLFICK